MIAPCCIPFINYTSDNLDVNHAPQVDYVPFYSPLMGAVNISIRASDVRWTSSWLARESLHNPLLISPPEISACARTGVLDITGDFGDVASSSSHRFRKRLLRPHLHHLTTATNIIDGVSFRLPIPPAMAFTTQVCSTKMANLMAPLGEPGNGLCLFLVVVFAGASIFAYGGIFGYLAGKLQGLRYLISGPQIIDKAYAKVSVPQVFLLPISNIMAESRSTL